MKKDGKCWIKLSEAGFFFCGILKMFNIPLCWDAPKRRYCLVVPKFICILFLQDVAKH